MTSGPGIEPGTHWWKASALTIAPTCSPDPTLLPRPNPAPQAVFQRYQHNRLFTFMSSLFWLSRQIYIAGANNEHLKDVRKAALESTKAAVRRLSLKRAQGSLSSRASEAKPRTSKTTKNGKVSPEMRYMCKQPSNHTYVLV